MPGSFPVFDAVVERFIEIVSPSRALDIGTGSGKYGRMLKRAVPECWCAGVEVEQSFVDRFGLHSVYDRLDVADVAAWWPAHLDETYDVVILGDCLEHIGKSLGIDLLNALVYRAAWLLVVTPEFVVQGVAGGVRSESHVSVWSERDLGWHDLWAFDNCRAVTVAVLRGYQPASLPMQALVDTLNRDAVSIRDFDGTTAVRPAHLRLVEHPREVAYRRL